MIVLLADKPEQASMSTILKPDNEEIFPKWFVKRRNYVAPNSTVFPDITVFSGDIIDLLQKLNSFTSLKYNWDSYGAIPPSLMSIRNARRFLFKNANVSLPFYFVSPGINGEVMIELNKDQKAAEIYFNPDGSEELLLFENNNCILEKEDVSSYTDLIEFFNE